MAKNPTDDGQNHSITIRESAVNSKIQTEDNFFILNLKYTEILDPK